MTTVHIYIVRHGQPANSEPNYSGEPTPRLTFHFNQKHATISQIDMHDDQPSHMEFMNYMEHLHADIVT